VSAGTFPRDAEPIHGTFLVATRATWAAAPMVVATSVVWALAAVPVVLAVVAGLPIPWVAVTLPFLLVTTGVFRVWAAVAAGSMTGWRRLTSIDPGLALIAWCLVLAMRAFLSQGDAGLVVSCGIGAFSALVLPLSFAYGAVRERRGAEALRGGLVLATLRPDLAVTLAAMIVLAGFVLVLSAGSLVLCVPALVAVFACAAVTAVLHRLGIVTA